MNNKADFFEDVADDGSRENEVEVLEVIESKPKKIVYFDLETQKSADDVGGWDKARDMLMSVGSIYIEPDGIFKSFTEDRVQELIDELFSADLVIGFNNIGFDNQVLTHYTDKDFSTIPTIDMARDFSDAKGHRIKLDYLAQGSLKDVKKSADGLAALRWFKEGKIDEITHYCEQDVAVTRDVYKYIEANKSVKYLDGRSGITKEAKIDMKIRKEK